MKNKLVSLPNDYVKKGDYKSCRKFWLIPTLIVIIFSVAVYFVLGPMSPKLSKELNALLLCMQNSQSLIIIFIICVLFSIILNAYLHEGLHWIFLRIFTGKKPIIHKKILIIPIKTTCPNEAYCYRNQAIIAALSPLLLSVLFILISFILWLLSKDILFALFNLLVLWNFLISFDDMCLTIWILKYPVKDVFGFKDGVCTIYGI